MKNFLPLLEGVFVTEKSSMNTIQSEPRTSGKKNKMMNGVESHFKTVNYVY